MKNVGFGIRSHMLCSDAATLSGLGEEEAETVLSALCAVAEPVESRFPWRPQLRDPADEMVFETAVNGNADALVTFNRRSPRTDAPSDRGVLLRWPFRLSGLPVTVDSLQCPPPGVMHAGTGCGRGPQGGACWQVHP